MYRKRMNIWSKFRVQVFFMRIATWNINSVRLRIANVLRFIKEFDINVMCPQETLTSLKI